MRGSRSSASARVSRSRNSTLRLRPLRSSRGRRLPRATSPATKAAASSLLIPGTRKHHTPCRRAAGGVDFAQRGTRLDRRRAMLALAGYGALAALRGAHAQSASPRRLGLLLLNAPCPAPRELREALAALG